MREAEHSWWSKLPEKMEQWSVWLVFGLITLVLIRTAWQSDDAYITYRCIDNALHGHGLTFNPGERVQAFTHPLWMFVQLISVSLTGEVYFTGMALGAIFTLLTGWLLLTKVSDRPLHFGLAMLALLSSSAWVDYSTSGLENALSHFLLVLFLVEWLRQKRLLHLCLIASFIVLNRMDMLLLVAPTLFAVWWPQRSLRTVGQVILGFLPFLLWEVFAIFYYGFPFPNTAYAKLNTEIPSGELMDRGFHYLSISLRNDLPSIFLPVAGVILGIVGRRHRLLPIAIGISLYFFYIVKIGGGFMEGRFLTGPVIMGVVLIWIWVQTTRPSQAKWILGGLAVTMAGIALVQAPASMVTGMDFLKDKEDILSEGGVADERSYYYFQTGLLKVLAEPDRPLHTWAEDGLNMRAAAPNHFVADNMGFLGYHIGPEKYIVDGLALTDPLLSRLPPLHEPEWRPGHLRRVIPEGYMEGLAAGDNRVVEPDLHLLNEELRQVTRGDLWSWERMKAIFRLNFGGQKLDDRHRFLYPVPQLRGHDYPLPSGVPIPQDDSKTISLGHFRGVKIALPAFGPPYKIEIGVENGFSYTAIVRSGPRFFKSYLIERDKGREDGNTLHYTIDLEDEWQPQEGDELLIYGMWLYGKQTLKYVRLGGG